MSVPAPAYPLRSVVHLIRPTGASACTLEDLRAGIAECSGRSLFLHTRHCRLRQPVGEEAAQDDFSAWIHGVVQDRETAERISFVVQSGGDSAEEQRAALLEALSRIPDSARARGVPPEAEFVFLTLESVPLDAGVVVRNGRETVHALTDADHGVWFYHLIEDPWFPDGATLTEWLTAIGEEKLARWLSEDAASGIPIETMRKRLLRRWRQSRLGRRVGEAAGATEDQRREVGRDVVARLVRRITTSSEPPA